MGATDAVDGMDGIDGRSSPFCYIIYLMKYNAFMDCQMLQTRGNLKFVQSRDGALDAGEAIIGAKTGQLLGTTTIFFTTFFCCVLIGSRSTVFSCLWKYRRQRNIVSWCAVNCTALYAENYSLDYDMSRPKELMRSFGFMKKKTEKKKKSDWSLKSRWSVYKLVR